MVFLYHNRKYWRGDLHPEVLRFFNELHMGVSLFFVLSGFLIAYTYGTTPLQSGNYLRYIALRAARILPVYWLILTAMYLDFGDKNASQTILTYLLAHGFSQYLNLTGIAQAWTLSVEMTFYLLAPLLALYLPKPFKLLCILAGMLAAALAAGYVWKYANGNPQHFLYPFSFVISGTFFGRSFEFVAGMMLAKFMLQQHHPLVRIPSKTLIGGAGMVIVIYCIGLFEKNIFSHGTEHPAGLILAQIIFPLFAVMFFHGLMVEKTVLQRFLGSKIMVLLGNASFVFYLIHISYVNIKIKQWILMPDRNFVLLWVLSVVIFLLIEKPLYEQCRKWLGYRKS